MVLHADVVDYNEKTHEIDAHGDVHIDPYRSHPQTPIKPSLLLLINNFGGGDFWINHPIWSGCVLVIRVLLPSKFNPAISGSSFESLIGIHRA